MGGMTIVRLSEGETSSPSSGEGHHITTQITTLDLSKGRRTQDTCLSFASRRF